MSVSFTKPTLANRVARHLASGAIVATSAACMTAERAQGAVVHAVVNWVVPNTIDGIYINVQTREVASTGSLVAGWDLNPYSDVSLTWFNATGTGMMRFPGVTTGSAGCLSPGTIVGPLASYGSGTVVVGAAPGNWHLNSMNYFGFRFIASDGQLHYGWGKFAVGASIAGADRTITEIAWDTVANRTIVVGDTGAPPPSYDPCSPSNPSAAVGSNALAMNQTTAADLSIASCGFTIRKANYFKFVAPAAGTYTVGTCDTAADTRIAVLNGCGPKAAVLACDDNSCGIASRTTFTAVASGTYYIVVGGVSADLPGTIALQVDPPWPTCSAPMVAGVGANPYACLPMQASQLVSSSTTAGINRTIYNTTWFEFVPPASGRYRFSLCGATGNTQIAIAQACAASPTSALTTLAYDDDGCACADGFCGGLAGASVIDDSIQTDKPLVNPLVAGARYLIAIGGFSSGEVPSGALVIEDAAANYDPCSPLNPVAAEGPNVLPLTSSPAADRDLGACGVIHRANLFKFVPAFSGQYIVSTCGAGADTALAVLDGCSTTAGVVACARDNCGTQESIPFLASAGTTYYIAVGAGAASVALPSPIAVTITSPPDPSCLQAAPLAFGANPFSNAASSASRTVRSSAAGETTVIFKAIYYSFTPAVTGMYGFSLCGGIGDSQMAVGTACSNLGVRFESIAYNDESCGSLSVVDATNGGAAGSPFGGFPLTQPLVAGQPYRVLVGSFDGTQAVSGTLVVSGPPQGNPADLDHNGVVNAGDLAILLGNWGGSGAGDIDGDGSVGAADLAQLLSAWGS